MLNVALGGTMVQDLSLVEAWRLHPSDPSGRLWRRFQDAAGRQRVALAVRSDPGQGTTVELEVPTG